MNRGLWLPLVGLLFSVQGFVSHRSNATQSRTWFLIGWFLQCIPVWQIIVRTSSDIVLDGLLFDVVLTLGYSLTMMACTGSFARLGWLQWAGFLMALVGMFIFKKG